MTSDKTPLGNHEECFLQRDHHAGGEPISHTLRRAACCGSIRRGGGVAVRRQEAGANGTKQE
jgi:hypothetical protein